MASSYKDSNPNGGASKKGGMKNEDGREGGSGWNKDSSTFAMNDKAVDSMPNEGAPELKKQGVIGKVI